MIRNRAATPQDALYPPQGGDWHFFHWLSKRAFTLVELMVAMAVTILLIGLLAGIAQSTSQAWKHGSDRTETFSGARSALSLIGRELQGALIDLDLGYSVRSKDENDYVLKFLTRRQPTAQEPSGIQKVAYQLAWASRGLVPDISEDYSSGHPIPVLVRTVSYSEEEMQDVFNITGGSEPWDWVNNWPTPADLQNPEKTEVVAEYILGWEVNPIYFDPGNNEVVVDNAESSGPFTFVDDGAGNPPRYITSDLKYVKKVSGMETVTSDAAPRAIEIRLAALPSSIAPRLSEEAGLGNVRGQADLFHPQDLSNTPFNNLLKQHLRVFDAAYFLSSKTP